MSARVIRDAPGSVGEPEGDRPGSSDAGKAKSLFAVIFACENCGEAIQLEHVVSVDAERLEGAVTGYILLDHRCDCSAEAFVQSRSWGSFPAFLSLFGRMPVLPYESPFAPATVTADHPAIRRWRWELEQVADVDEFRLFLDDAGAGRTDPA